MVFYKRSLEWKFHSNSSPLHRFGRCFLLPTLTRVISLCATETTEYFCYRLASWKLHFIRQHISKWYVCLSCYSQKIGCSGIPVSAPCVWIIHWGGKRWHMALADTFHSQSKWHVHISAPCVWIHWHMALANRFLWGKKLRPLKVDST